MEEKILKAKMTLIRNIGLVCAAITMVAYITCLIVLYWGMSVSKTLDKTETIVFIIVSAAVGALISVFLSFQGWEWASQLEENKKIISRRNEVPKLNKGKSAGLIWFIELAKTILIKFGSVAATMYLVIEFTVKGVRDPSMMWAGVTNLLVWLSLGLLGIARMYDTYNNKYIVYIKNKLKENDNA